MKKIILTTMLCGIMLIIITGCGTKKGFSIGKKSNMIVEDKGISLFIKENTLTPSGATLILKNNSGMDV